MLATGEIVAWHFLEKQSILNNHWWVKEQHMGVSLYAVAETKPTDFDDYLYEKALSYVDADVWVELFETLNITSFFDFIQASEEQLEDEDFDLPDEMRQIQWFDASEGLHVFRTLKQHFIENPNLIDSEEQTRVIEALGQFEEVLSVYQKQNIRFHLCMDF